MLLFMLLKTFSVFCIEHVAVYLSTDYVDATIDFVQAYIQVLDILHSQRNNPRRHRDAPLPGFADVHYHINAPGSVPQHHRFERASYVYLFQNATRRRSRIEIANRAGTAEQDAFNGYLDTTALAHNSKQPNLVSLTVNTAKTRPTSSLANDQALWSIAAFDLRHEKQYLYRLHTVDLYFWKPADAAKLVEIYQLPSSPIQRSSLSPRFSFSNNGDEQITTTSPVVNQLEKAAIIESTRAQLEGMDKTCVQTSQDDSASMGRASPYSSATASQAAVAPYNPTAPAAPEPIAHREKTPPPPEAARGPGLAAAAVADSQATQPTTPYAVHTSILVQPHPSSHDKFLPPPPPAPWSASPPPPFPNPPPQPSPMPEPAPDAAPTLSTYTYAPAAPQEQTHTSVIHTQFYVPTAAELAHGHMGSHATVSRALGHRTGAEHDEGGGHGHGHDEGGGHGHGHGEATAKKGRLDVKKVEARVARVEKGVNRWLKRLDGKI